MATFSRSLDYVGGLKRRAVSARSFRVVVNSKSGSTFTSGTSATVDLPVIPRTFGDLNNMYVMFDIKSGQDTADNVGALQHSGYDVFNRITVSSGGGSVISDCQNVNRYYTAILQQRVGHEWCQGYAAEAIGHRGDNSPFGIDLPRSSETAKTLCLPLLHGVCTADKLLNLDSALPLSFTFYFEDYMNALVNSTNNDAGDYSITNFRIVMNCTELAPEAMVVLNEAVGDFGYAMNFTELQCVTDLKPAAVSQHITNLGFRHSSLNKITLLQFDQSISKDLQENSLSNRSYSDLNELCFHINGVKYPQNHIKGSANNFSEFLTETMLANGTLGDAGSNNSLNYKGLLTDYNAVDDIFDPTALNVGAIGEAINGAVNTINLQVPQNMRNYELNQGMLNNNAFATSTVTRSDVIKTGTFLVSYDFSSFKSPQDDSGLYSGISSLAGNITAEMKYGSSANFPCDLYFYSESDRILSIDPVSRTHEVTD